VKILCLFVCFLKSPLFFNQAWHHDVDVFDSSVQLLQSLSLVRDARIRVLSKYCLIIDIEKKCITHHSIIKIDSNSFQELVTSVDAQLLLPLSASIHSKSLRRLAAALLRLGSKIEDQVRLHSYFADILFSR
jgi:hypothetical protein